jgi:two-component system chemotaxis response regulator CheY
MSDVSSAVLSLDSQTEKRGPLRLLIVDDDVVQRELLQRASRLAGCETVLAPSCAEAVRLVRSMQFDCVILDLELEDGDGVDVCRAMADIMQALTVVSDRSYRQSTARAVARSVGIGPRACQSRWTFTLRVCLANSARAARAAGVHGQVAPRSVRPSQAIGLSAGA